jgi:hypothetical protein
MKYKAYIIDSAPQFRSLIVVVSCLVILLIDLCFTLLLQEVMAWCVAVVGAVEGEEELFHHIWVPQIVTKTAIRMGLQAHIRITMETDISLIGK